MSSGAILVAPGAIGFAAGAVVVLAAAGAAVLVVRAASAAAEGMVRALGDYGERLEQQADEQHDAALQAMMWESVAADVVELNARIRMVMERAKRSGAVVALPKPLRLSGLTTADAITWSVRAAQALRSAQETMHAAVAVTEGQSIAAGLPPSVAARPDTAAALARFQTALSERYTRQQPTPPAPRVDSAAAVAAVLRTLDVDANEQEHADVLGAAAMVPTDDARTAAAYLRTLQKKVSDVNKVVERRRLAAQWLSALEEPVVADADLPEPFLGTAAKLRAVVAGDADMEPRLRAEASRAVDWAAEQSRRHFVNSMMRDCLADLGYTVDAGFDLQRSTDVRVTRSTWHDEHSAQIFVDSKGALQGRLVREYAMEGDEAVMRDRTRCAEFNGALVELGQRLNVEVRTDDKHVPQLASAAVPESTTVTKPGHRYHS